MFRITVLAVLFVSVLMAASSAYAGRVELTTYYPAPTGEYKDVKATNTLKVPVVVAGTKTVANTTPGEIWVEG